MKKEGGCEGGCEWYQSTGHIFLYISANFLLLKDPGPLNNKNTHFSGLTTRYAPRLNKDPSAAKNQGFGSVFIFYGSGSRALLTKN